MFVADRHRMTYRLLFLALCIFCSACAARPTRVETTAQAAQTNDPLEPYNRSVMKLNGKLTTYLIRPVVTVYRALLPKPIRNGLANISANARAPLVFVHDVLQAEPSRAFQTLGRFLMNTTAGLGGTFDVAARAGVPAHDEDAGQTFARWGMPSGPYLMLPLLGPSTLRDTFGFATDMFADPLRYVLRSPTVPRSFGASPLGTGVALSQQGSNVRSQIGTGLLIVSLLSQLDQNIDRLGELDRGALDPYIALRESYRQYRAAEIANGKSGPPKAEDDPLAGELDVPK
jgi:phospholipid-binding lipoprotein MlaA